MTLFANDPVEFFAGQPARGHYLPHAEREALQLGAAQARFASLKDELPPLAVLAQHASIHQLDDLDQLASLLFPQQFYKSFNENLLRVGDYAGMTSWLQNLTSVSLRSLMGQPFPTLDAWIDAVEDHAGVSAIHSTGTTGKLSFFPRAIADGEVNFRHSRHLIPDWTGRESDAEGAPPFAVIWMGFARGRSAFAKGGDNFRRNLARSPGHFLPTMEGEMSADWHWFMMMAQQAQTAGATLPRPSDYVEARNEEMEQARLALPGRIDAILDRLRGDLAGQRILLAGPPALLFDLAEAGRKRGISNICAPGSELVAFGGFKQRGPISGMERAISTFSGLSRSQNFYAMTEMNGAAFACDHGNFHLLPTLIPFVIDERSGMLKPRGGTQTGRAAFFDVVARTSWGGIVSADRVTISWERCACGRSSPHIEPGLERIPDGEAALPPCPAGADALRAAIEVLTGDGTGVWH